MQCKTENPGKGEFDCMKEGRRVTRCATSVYVPCDAEMWAVGDGTNAAGKMICC
jgi:hypothetical protein